VIELRSMVGARVSVRKQPGAVSKEGSEKYLKVKRTLLG
jgi:hypothetical protein